MEVGKELIEEIIPKAVFFHMGNSVETMLHNGYGSMDDKEEEEKGNGHLKPGGRGRGRLSSKAEVCKKQ
ncbi:unnamed protein product [Phytomonas sp. EM1]|nr:unnamed protein product [Phytomonas sp. EM1]|eukprot:CCW65172.1 unnamed protein product [Phytomonas sp. isolate EM1]